jgi:hypothetical protein
LPFMVLLMFTWQDAAIRMITTAESVFFINGVLVDER